MNLKLLLVIAVLAGLAAAAGPSSAARARDTWATINICDTKRHPDVLGLRAQATGNGTAQRIFMRFRAQYRSSSGRWRPVRGKGSSGFINAGSARYRTRQAGYSFRLEKRTVPTTYRLRGKVDIEYRLRKPNGNFIVKRRLRRTTTANRPADGAEPKGYSSAEGVIRVAKLRPVG